VSSARGRSLPLGRVEPRSEQSSDVLARAATRLPDRDELAGLSVPPDEQRVEDAQRAAGLHPLQCPPSWPSKLESAPKPNTMRAGRIGLIGCTAQLHGH
jgi:hypothetical protein